MDDLGFAVTMRANQSTAGRAVCAAIAPRPACSRTFSLLARFQTVERWTANFGFLRSHLAAHRRFAARTLSLFFIFQRRLTCRRVSLLRRASVASMAWISMGAPGLCHPLCHRNSDKSATGKDDQDTNRADERDSPLSYFQSYWLPWGEIARAERSALGCATPIFAILLFHLLRRDVDFDITGLITSNLGFAVSE